MPEIIFQNNLAYIPLVNTVSQFAVIDKNAYDKIIKNSVTGTTYFNILSNLRKHNPREFPYWQQKITKNSVGNSKKTEVVTIYLHKLVADLFLKQPSEKTLVSLKNGINIDCRTQNVQYKKQEVRKNSKKEPVKNPLLLFLAHLEKKPPLKVILLPIKTELVNVETGMVVFTSTNFTSPKQQNERVVDLLVEINCQAEHVEFVVLNNTFHEVGSSVFDILPFRNIIKHEAPTG